MEKLKLDITTTCNYVKEYLMNIGYADTINITYILNDDNVPLYMIEVPYYHNGIVYKQIANLSNYDCVKLLKTIFENKGYNVLYINTLNRDGKITYNINYDVLSRKRIK